MEKYAAQNTSLVTSLAEEKEKYADVQFNLLARKTQAASLKLLVEGLACTLKEGEQHSSLQWIGELMRSGGANDKEDLHQRLAMLQANEEKLHSHMGEQTGRIEQLVRDLESGRFSFYCEGSGG